MEIRKANKKTLLTLKLGADGALDNPVKLAPLRGPRCAGSLHSKIHHKAIFSHRHRQLANVPVVEGFY